MCAVSKAADNPTFTLIHVSLDLTYELELTLIYDVNVINVFHRKECI